MEEIPLWETKQKITNLELSLKLCEVKILKSQYSKSELRRSNKILKERRDRIGKIEDSV